MHGLNHTGGDSSSLRQYAAVMYCKAVGKNVKDFHGSNEFCNYILDVHILACLMQEIETKTLAELHLYLRQNNYPMSIAERSVAYGDPYVV